METVELEVLSRANLRSELVKFFFSKSAKKAALGFSLKIGLTNSQSAQIPRRSALPDRITLKSCESVSRGSYSSTDVTHEWRWKRDFRADLPVGNGEINFITWNACSTPLTGDGLKWTLEFHLIDAMVGRLAISASLGDGLLAGTTANADAVNDESLLRAISLEKSESFGL